jgi:single-strand DNA-binding protein
VTAPASALHRNEVLLCGRLAAPVEHRELPSGDLLALFRLVVERPPRRRKADDRAPSVDTFDCVAWRARVRRSAGGWRPGDVLEVNGTLRRRFWRSPAGPASRCEIEVVTARVVRHA